MKLLKITYVLAAVTFSLIGNAQSKKAATDTKNDSVFNYVVEQFADIRVLRYQITDWDNLTLKEKELVYYLTEA